MPYPAMSARGGRPKVYSGTTPFLYRDWMFVVQPYIRMAKTQGQLRMYPGDLEVIDYLWMKRPPAYVEGRWVDVGWVEGLPKAAEWEPF